uniref:Uncharacterized protein n=1 Tax=Arundo donax TaxID=35708 RepID=A0A0A9FYH6_ARUDO
MHANFLQMHNSQCNNIKKVKSCNVTLGIIFFGIEP